MSLLLFIDFLATFIGYGVIGLFIGHLFADMCVFISKPVMKVVQSQKIKNVLNTTPLSGNKLT